MNKYLNEVVSYGGLPLRKGSVILDLQKICSSNWDAGLMGLDAHNKMHPLPPGTEPITLAKFYQIIGG